MDTKAKDELVNALYQASDCLKKKAGLEEELKKVKTKYRATEGGYRKPWHGVQPIAEKIILAIVILIFLAILQKPMSRLVYILYYSFYFPAGLAKLVVKLIQLAIFVGVFFVVQTMVNKSVVKNNQKNTERLERNKVNNQAVAQEEETLKVAYSQVLGGYQAVESLLPEGYKQNSYAMYFMAEALRNERANTLGEAINLYEEDAHRRRVEEKQDEMIRKQQEANTIAAVNAMANISAANSARRQADIASQQAADTRRAADAVSDIRNKINGSF